MTNLGHEINPADARRRKIRATQLIFAGAAAVATLALFSAARPGSTDTAVATGLQFAQTAPGWAGAGGFASDDGGVNDNGQTSGDIFTQNAQDQSTA
jgi:hypothetical protein